VTEPSTEQQPDERTIDELASHTGVPSRTIRFYQSKGVLKPPRIRGRVAYYGPEHAERLELIAQLQDRGLRIDAIRELLLRADKGEVDVGDWLGLDAKLRASWAHDQPRAFSDQEIAEQLTGRRKGLLADLVRTGLLERKDDVYFAESPALLRVVLELERVGVDPAVAAKGGEILRKHLGKAARELAELFLSEAANGHVRVAEEDDLGKALEALRPSALESVRVVFGREMERTLRQLVESGKTTTLGPKKKRPR
jgi:DNA-binding transcriptional MerR regulator